MPSVYLLEDHELMRDALIRALERDAIEVVGFSGDAATAMAEVPRLMPDVVLCDVNLPDGDGIEVCRLITERYPPVACLVLTGFVWESAVLDSARAGASGLLEKTIRPEALAAAIRTVAAGGSLFTPSQVRLLIEHPSGIAERVTSLNGQERKVLDLIGEGLTNREISIRLFLAEQTVKNYNSSVKRKLGLRHRAEVAVYASKLTDGRSHLS